jgi:murein L,D-transpeptidase YafK
LVKKAKKVNRAQVDQAQEKMAVKELRKEEVDKIRVEKTKKVRLMEEEEEKIIKRIMEVGTMILCYISFSTHYIKMLMKMFELFFLNGK